MGWLGGMVWIGRAFALVWLVLFFWAMFYGVRYDARTPKAKKTKLM